jgi:GNAT superfamily N-acetyltransferase
MSQSDHAHVRRLGPADAEAYRALCLRAYAEHPDAFTATVEERAAKPMAFWLARVNDALDAPECVFGAFAGERLVGFTGLDFETRPKTCHKAGLFGMYVCGELRGRGLGDALVQAALTEARARSGVRMVKLTVTEGNAPAEALYARCRFVRFGVEPMAMLDTVRGGYLAKVHMVCVL